MKMHRVEPPAPVIVNIILKILIYINIFVGNVNTNNTTVYELAQLDDLWFQAILNEKETIENGVTAIIDMKGYTWKMLRWLTPANIKIAAQSAELIPIKHMEFHVINSSKLLNTAVALIFPFLGQRLKDQIHFHHCNMKSLQAQLGENALPVEYGGLLELDYDDIYRNLKKSNEFQSKKFQYIKQ